MIYKKIQDTNTKTCAILYALYISYLGDEHLGDDTRVHDDSQVMKTRRVIRHPGDGSSLPRLVALPPRLDAPGVMRCVATRVIAALPGPTHLYTDIFIRIVFIYVENKYLPI